MVMVLGSSRFDELQTWPSLFHGGPSSVPCAIADGAQRRMQREQGS